MDYVALQKKAVLQQAEFLREAAEKHHAFEATRPRHDWEDWYAAYVESRQRGLSPEEAEGIAGQFIMDLLKHRARASAIAAPDDSVEEDIHSRWN